MILTNCFFTGQSEYHGLNSQLINLLNTSDYEKLCIYSFLFIVVRFL